MPTVVRCILGLVADRAAPARRRRAGQVQPSPGAGGDGQHQAAGRGRHTDAFPPAERHDPRRQDPPPSPARTDSSSSPAASSRSSAGTEKVSARRRRGALPRRRRAGDAARDQARSPRRCCTTCSSRPARAPTSRTSARQSPNCTAPRTPAPLSAGPHEFSLTRVTSPVGAPPPPMHHRSGAALYRVLSGTGTIHLQGKDEPRGTGRRAVRTERIHPHLGKRRQGPAGAAAGEHQRGRRAGNHLAEVAADRYSRTMSARVRTSARKSHAEAARRLQVERQFEHRRLLHRHRRRRPRP